MVDYARFADQAKAIQDADKVAVDKHKKLSADPCAFFERVKVHLVEEMKKANWELRRKGAAMIDRNHLYGFDEDVFLTYGTDSLCRVEFGIQAGGWRITAVISGPPNGCEISRKEYLCNQEASCLEVLDVGKEGLPAVVVRPDEIAVDIISGILAGKFD
jgi:hypothetical protein